jgi:hypothetical protein
MNFVTRFVQPKPLNEINTALSADFKNPKSEL